MKIGGVEIGAPEIAELGKWLDRIFNSRMGLALLVAGVFYFGALPRLENRLESIDRNTALAANSGNDTKGIVSQSRDLLLDLAYRCNMRPLRQQRRGETDPHSTDTGTVSRLVK